MYGVPNTEETFWARTKRAANGCLEWQGSKTVDGYGRFSMPGTKERLAPRFAWEFAIGEKPGDMDVCHTCDNRACVDPAHLFLGTALDNICQGKNWKHVWHSVFSSTSKQPD